ncbi:MAG TPA: acetate--CoA ligase family protein [Nocardioidaceae bacterium]|nr:acetate--CoA ligase family protein [Nocardioidaceae bacterium]
MTERTGLDRLVAPASVAIVGMSADPSKHGGKVLTSLRRFGYAGPVWGVNPNRPEVDGIEVVAALTDLPTPPDVVIVAVPAAATPDVIRTAGELGAGAAILFGGGFAESGDDGAALQTQIVELARQHGLRLLGPNSAGVIHPSAGTVLSFLTCLERPADQLRPGPVGLITQSGGTGSFLHNLAAERDSGFALSISTGNEADVDAGEALQHLVDHPDIRAIALVLETVRDGPRFVAAARAALRAEKPVVVCKIGRSEIGQRVMRTHTGALAGSERRYDAAFDALGITVTTTPTELFDVSEQMARAAVPAGDRVGIVTHSGGTAVLLADQASGFGLRLPQPSDALRERLGPYLQHGASGNPTDLGGIITAPHRYVEVVRCFVDDPAYDVVVPVSTPHPTAHTHDRAVALAALAKETDKPLLNLWLAGDLGADGLRVLREADVAVTTDIDSLVRAVSGLARLGARRRDPDPSPEPPDPVVVDQLNRANEVLSEADSLRLVAAMGLPAVDGQMVDGPEHAVRTADALGYPVVLKAVSTDLPHKSDVGAVRLNLATPAELAAAYEDLTTGLAATAPTAQVDGFLVQRYVPGVEMLLGIVRDPTFGPVVLVGTGGTVAEAIDDVAAGLPPLTTSDAARLIGSLRGRVLLRGFRGGPTGDEEALARLVTRLSDIAIRYGDHIEELDVNPVVYAEGRWLAADALLRPRLRD